MKVPKSASRTLQCPAGRPMSTRLLVVRWGWGWGWWWSLHLHFTQTFKQMASLNWHPNQWLAPGFGGRVSVIYFNAAFSLFWLIGVIMKITFPSSLPTAQNLTCWAFNVSFKIQIFVCITLSACLWTSVIFEWPAPLRLRDFPGLANERASAGSAPKERSLGLF